MYQRILCVVSVLCAVACTAPVKNPKPPAALTEAEDLNTVTVNFFNASSFKADVYMHVNPSASDTSAKPLVTVAAGSVGEVQLPPSTDQTVGDVFYIRYYVQLADAFSSGTGQPIYVKAQRDISNIAFVLQKNETYTKTITQPASGQLKFLNGYIKVQNTGTHSFQVLQGSTHLKKLGNNDINLASGVFGFYELSIPALDDSEHISSLNCFVTDTAHTISVPSFQLERGKVYSFQCNGTNITGPSVTSITY